MRIVFRADGNSTIGLGHIVRCLALAEMVYGLFAERWLAVQEPSAAVQELARQAQVQLWPMPVGQGPAEAAALAALLLPTDVVVLDGYEFRTAYQEAIKASGCRVVAIDDLHAWPQQADLIINHAPGITPALYEASAAARYCLGPEFSLVRAPFRHRFRLPTPPSAITSVAVCFGGADPAQLTLRMLVALSQQPAIQRVSLVIGSAFAQPELLLNAVQNQFKGTASVYQNLSGEEMATLFLAHQAIVCPASTVLLESLLLGCPVITGHFADNQRHLAEYVHAHQQAYSLGNFLEHSDSQLPVALATGLDFLQTQVRTPYAQALQTEQLRAEFQRLLAP